MLIDKGSKGFEFIGYIFIIVLVFDIDRFIDY